MLPFVAAGVAAGGVSYFIGLPLAYAAFLAIAIVAVAVGVTSALTVKVPQIEPKARKLKTEKNRHGSAAASSSLSSDTAADTSSEKPDKAEDNNNKSEPKALSKRDKERAKKAAKKEADEKQKQAEADRAAAEEKQKQQEAARAAKEAAAAAAKAAEAAEKERLAALEAEEDEEDEAPAKKNKKKKKKKTEEKKGNDSAAPTPTAKSSESKNAAPTPTAKSSAPTPTAKKGEAADSKKSKDSSAKAEAASNKVDASKKVEVAPKNTESSNTPAAAVEFEEKVDAKESAAQDSSMAWEVKTSKKNKRAPEPTAAAAAAAVVPLTPTTTSASSDQKVETTIDPRNFGVIIGKGGSTLKQIMEATQTNIDFSKKEEGRVTVSGPSRENIDKAITAMNQLAAKGYSDLTHGVRDEGSIEVPSNKRFNIIGTKGETVRLIQDRLKVKVNMPDRNTNDSTVTVLGENADVQEALRCISDLMTKGYSEITHPGWVSEVVEVPSGQLGNIIGAQGATVREIQDTTGAKINIEGSTVTVLGQQTQVAEAKNKITQLLTPAEPLPADPEWSQGASARYVDLW